LLSLARVAQRLACPFLRRLNRFVQTLAQILLALIELAGRLAHLPHFVIELSRRSAAKLIAQLLKRLFRSRARRGGLRHTLLFECLGGALRLFTSLLKLLALRRHPL